VRRKQPRRRASAAPLYAPIGSVMCADQDRGRCCDDRCHRQADQYPQSFHWFLLLRSRRGPVPRQPSLPVLQHPPNSSLPCSSAKTPGRSFTRSVGREVSTHLSIPLGLRRRPVQRGLRPYTPDQRSLCAIFWTGSLEANGSGQTPYFTGLNGLDGNEAEQPSASFPEPQPQLVAGSGAA
jgi:hypothetical protein